MYQGIAMDRILEGARQVEEAAVGGLPLVEVYHEGKHLGTADPKLARAVVMAIKLKRILDQVQEQLTNYVEEVKMRVKEAGLRVRPVSLIASGEGRVTVSAKGATVKIDDPRGLYAIFGEAMFDLVSMRPKRELKQVALSGDHPQADEIRACLSVEQSDEDTVTIRTKV